MMLTLYQVEWCPYCHRVRQVMTELGLTYITVNVQACLLYTSPSPRDGLLSRMPSSA